MTTVVAVYMRLHGHTKSKSEFKKSNNKMISYIRGRQERKNEWRTRRLSSPYQMMYVINAFFINEILNTIHVFLITNDLTSKYILYIHFVLFYDIVE